jgi:integration host factor subunit alpha
MTLTKEHIRQSIENHLITSRFESSRLIASVMEIIKRTLESGEDVLISGFGKFSVRGKAARRGRNPETGKDLALEPRRVVSFKCSGRLKDKINGKVRSSGLSLSSGTTQVDSAGSSISKEDLHL